MVSRRSFLTSSALLGTAALATGPLGRSAWALSPSSMLTPGQVPQFVQLLPNPLDTPCLMKPDTPGGTAYTVVLREFTQDLGLGTKGTLPTQVWGYGTPSQAATFPGPTFEVQRHVPVTVRYVNALVDKAGKPLPNRMPVDTTLDWASPGAIGGLTPVPAVAHLHGGDSQYTSDGLPDAWATPGDAVTVQTGRLFATPYSYENAQEAGTLWYHDHALGITRTNVYMGLAGFYLLRDENEADLRARNVLPSHPYEVPVVIQDRTFTAGGQLAYPSSAQGNLPSPTHLPEFFGDVLLVNGKAWPKLGVEPRKYRLRLLNGSDSRFYDLRLEVFAKASKIQAGAGVPVPMLVIGTELGLLDTPAVPDLNGVAGVLPIGPGERFDVIADFTGLAAGTRVLLTNTARSPYPSAAKPAQGTMDRVMAFDVTLPLSSTPNATVAAGTDLRPVHGKLPAIDTRGVPARRLMLFEGTDRFGRLQTMIGPVDRDPVTGQVGTLTFKDPVTERPRRGTTEIWEFYNTTVDAHPIHMHLVDFRILSREAFTGTLSPKVNSDGSNGATLAGIALAGAPRAPTAFEAGRKDTAKMFPGEVTRVLVSFHREGEYVYHCHILSHEDHEMMRPFQVV